MKKMVTDRKNPRLSLPDTSDRRAYETATMHPDDFRAHLAWVLAKQIHNP
jgi:hypothetical protein